MSSDTSAGLHIIYGNTRDEMTSKTQPYGTLRAAEAAYFALEFNRWAALMDGDRVLRTNVNTGPVVPRINKGEVI